ncbi:hypothetical protein SUNI508_11124 [Seiridium unicorne]|uniref:Uncharacterized protein n=1 Tax=Seiridium unicorne TaxID=138068 RepID=A0ABR2UJL7_9PEZI
MCLPLFCPRRCDGKAKRGTKSYKNHAKSKAQRSSQASSVGFEVKIRLLRKRRAASPARGPEYPLSLPRVQLVMMAEPSNIHASPFPNDFGIGSSFPSHGPCFCSRYHNSDGVQDPLVDSDDDNFGPEKPGRYYPANQDWHSTPVRSTPSHHAYGHPGRSVNYTHPDSAFDAVPLQLHPAFTSYPQIYVYPRSTTHVSFPVVDYSSSHWESETPWPHCYMAIAPRSATVLDLKATLTPKGSDTQLTARSLDDGNSIDLASFYDITDLRCKIIQLEVRDTHTKEKSPAEGSAEGSAEKPAKKKTDKGKGKEELRSEPRAYEDLHGASKSGFQRRAGRKKN